MSESDDSAWPFTEDLNSKIREMAENADIEFKRDPRAGVDEAIKVAFFIARHLPSARALMLPLHHLTNALAGLDSRP